MALEYTTTEFAKWWLQTVKLVVREETDTGDFERDDHVDEKVRKMLYQRCPCWLWVPNEHVSIVLYD